MPQFVYQAIDDKGSDLSGKVEAEDQWAAVARLHKMGYNIMEIREVKESPFKLETGRRIGIGDISFFTRQLAAMLGAGIPLTRGLSTLGEQGEHPKLATIVGEVARNVESGMNFSDALRMYPKVFSGMYVDMVKAGELGGSMEEMLRRISLQLDREKSLRDSIKSALFYPSVIVAFAILIVLVMLFFVVPMFKGFLPSGQDFKLPTRVVFWMSDSLRGYWYVYLIGFIITVTGIRLFLNSDAGRKAWDRYKFGLPLFGSLLKKVTIARFCRTFSTLLSGAIPVIQALETAGPASGSSLVTETVKEAGIKIQEGQSIAQPLKKSGFFPPMVINMIAVGEETGELSALLSRVADFYEEEVSTITRGLTAILEPMLIIIIGCAVGGIVFAIYMPIFDVVTKMGR